MFPSLTEKQREIVYDKTGLFAVRACPGSGKTYSVAARLAKEIDQWSYLHKGIAVISFTNVAWEEIRKQIRTNSDIKEIALPHFLGTIDAFINRYLVFPFGHLIMGCDKTPQLVGEPYGSWHARFGRGVDAYNQYFDKVSFGLGDQIVPTVPIFPSPFFFDPKSFAKAVPDGHIKNLGTIKLANWQQGFFTQADASYIALKLLKKYPAIARILVNRFPFMIIDEAQDTSEIQMAIIDHLLLNGLKNLMMVGDPDQAIFEWNDADPKLFKAKYELWKENSTILNENRRSSQTICNFTYKLSSLPNPSCAIAPELAPISLSPVICSYKDDAVDDIITNFRSLCVNNGVSITPENVAILYRGNSFCSILTKEPTFNTPWLDGYYSTRDIIKGKYYFDNINSKQGFNLIKKCYIKNRYQQNCCSDPLVSKAYEEIGYRCLVKETYRLISVMPDTRSTTLSQWVQSYNTIPELAHFQKLKINDANGTLLVPSYFANDQVKVKFPDMTVGTIHSVKGETFEAVLMFLKQRPSRGAYYRTLISQGSYSDNEEMRIVYVGMTRPRKLLMLAVPGKDAAAWSSLA